jgi:hypothetical protein
LWSLCDEPTRVKQCKSSGGWLRRDDEGQCGSKAAKAWYEQRVKSEEQ